MYTISKNQINQLSSSRSDIDKLEWFTSFNQQFQFDAEDKSQSNIDTSLKQISYKPHFLGQNIDNLMDHNDQIVIRPTNRSNPNLLISFDKLSIQDQKGKPRQNSQIITPQVDILNYKETLELPKMNQTKSNHSLDQFIRPSILLEQDMNHISSQEHTKFLVQNQADDAQALNQPTTRVHKRKQQKHHYIKTFHSRFTHNRVQLQYEVEEQDSIYVDDEELPIITTELQEYKYDVPIFDTDKFKEFPNSNMPNYDWDILSFIDNTPDIINNNLNQNDKFNDVKLGFNLDKYEMESLFSILNTDSKTLVLTAFDKHRKRPYTIKLKQWNDDVDYFEIVQELIIHRHVQNYSYPRIILDLKQNDSVVKSTQDYLKQLFSEASKIIDLVELDYDLDTIDEKISKFPSQLIQAAIKVQCLKMNGVVQLLDNYIVKKGSTRVLVMVMDYFDFTLKDYLIQFYRDEMHNHKCTIFTQNEESSDYQPIITYDDQLHLMFGISKVATNLERLGVYFNNYSPENIVFAKEGPNQSEPKLMIYNFNQCKIRTSGLEVKTKNNGSLNTLFEFEDDQFSKTNQVYRFFKHSTNLKYSPPEFTGKIANTKEQTTTIKADPSKVDSYSLGVLFIEIFHQRLLYYDEVAHQSLMLDKDNIICQAIQQLCQSKHKLRWSLREFRQYIKLQRQQLCNSSVLLRKNCVNKMWKVIQAFEQKTEKFLALLDLRQLAIAKGYRLIGQTHLCKEKISILKEKYIDNNFRAVESWKTQLSIYREIAYFYRDDNNFKLSFQFHEKLFELYKKYAHPNLLELVDVLFSFGLVKQAEGQYQSASVLYDQCVQNIRKYYDNDVGQPYLIKIIIQQGLLQLKKHEIGNSLHNFDQAQIIATSTYHLITPLCAQQLNNYCEIKKALKTKIQQDGNFSENIEISTKINHQLLTISLSSQGMQGPNMFEVLKYQGQCYYLQGKYDLAIKSFIKAGRFSKDMNLDLVHETYEDLIRYKIRNMREIQSLQEEIDKSFQEVHELKLNYLNPGLTHIFNGIGECYRILGNSVMGLIWFEKAQKCLALDNIVQDQQNFIKSQHDQPFYFTSDKLFIESQIQNNIGICYKNLNLYTKSIEAYQESIYLKQQVFGARTNKIAQPLFNIANLKLKAGAYSECIILYDEVQEIINQESQTAFFAEVLQNKGICYFYLNNNIKAMLLLKESLFISKEVVGPQSLAVAETLQNMGMILYQQGQQRKALTHFEEAAKYFKKQLPENHPHRRTLEQNLQKCSIKKR